MCTKSFNSNDGITKILYTVPSDEVVAAKRFALEADMGVDEEKIEYYRVSSDGFLVNFGIFVVLA